MSEILIGYLESFLRGHHVGYKEGLDDLKNCITEHVENGHKEISCDQVLEAINKLQDSKK